MQINHTIAVHTRSFSELAVANLARRSIAACQGNLAYCLGWGMGIASSSEQGAKHWSEGAKE